MRVLNKMKHLTPPLCGAVQSQVSMQSMLPLLQKTFLLEAGCVLP